MARWWAEADAEDERLDDLEERTRQRRRSSQAVQQIAADYPPPAPPADSTGEPVTNAADTTAIPTTELQTLDDFVTELSALLVVTRGVRNAIEVHQHPYLQAFTERYDGAKDMPKTPRMNACVASIDELQYNDLLRLATEFDEKFGWLLDAVREEQARLKEVGPATGRLENVGR